MKKALLLLILMFFLFGSSVKATEINLGHPIADNSLFSNLPNTNNGGNTNELDLDCCNIPVHIVMNFTNFTLIPAGAIISNARLDIYSFNEISTHWWENTINISEINTTWTESDSTWNNLAYQRNVSTAVHNITTQAEQTWWNITVTNIVQHWIDTGVINGFYIEAYGGSTTGQYCHNRPREYSDPSLGAYLIIKYNIPTTTTIPVVTFNWLDNKLISWIIKVF